jgi:uncharacterized protein YdaU (DUF1376 family)
MDEFILSRIMSELGRKGGKARLKTMTAAQRTRLARKAAKASVKARRAKAKKKARTRAALTVTEKLGSYVSGSERKSP